MVCWSERVRKSVRIRFSVGVKVRVRTGQGLKLVVEQYRGQINPIKFFEDSKKSKRGLGLRSG